MSTCLNSTSMTYFFFLIQPESNLTYSICLFYGDRNWFPWSIIYEASTKEVDRWYIDKDKEDERRKDEIRKDEIRKDEDKNKEDKEWMEPLDEIVNYLSTGDANQRYSALTKFLSKEINKYSN